MNAVGTSRVASMTATVVVEKKEVKYYNKLISLLIPAQLPAFIREQESS